MQETDGQVTLPRIHGFVFDPAVGRLKKLPVEWGGEGDSDGQGGSVLDPFQNIFNLRRRSSQSFSDPPKIAH